MSNSSRVGFKLAAVLLSSVLCVALLELGGTMLDIEPLHPWSVNPANLDVPFTTDEFDTRITTDAHGMRTLAAHVPGHLEGSPRVLVVGDSYTFGWGVSAEQAFPHQTQLALRSEPGLSQVAVMNMGRPGASLDLYLRFVMRYAPELHPDVIVVGFLPGNDCPVGGTVRGPDASEREALLHRYVDGARPRTPGVLERSFVYRLVRRRLPRLLRGTATPSPADASAGPVFGEANPLVALRARAQSGDSPELTARFERLDAQGWVDRALRWEVSPHLVASAIRAPRANGEALFLSPEREAAMQSEWELCESMLLQLRDAAQATGAQFRLLILPKSLQVDAEHREFRRQLGFEYLDEASDMERPNRLLATFCAAHAMTCFDPLQEFRSRTATGATLFFRQDGHPNALGHQLLGSHLARALQPTLREPR